jgi:hypothetical protein
LYCYATNFPRMDVKLEEGEGGISKPEDDGPLLGPPEPEPAAAAAAEASAAGAEA